ncbi:MAG: enoyl-CoA hydratase family protein [Planctomycetes bacterium]|jgi:enoyl-CoA hydratase/carnithine racemase|nr:enoyl-CoA hydratase family protein [Planctomycetota bacterium]
MNPKHFHYSESEGVATVRLDRPDRLNALTFDSYAELRDTFVALRTRASVRAVILTGTGRAFCSGGDVKDIIGRMFAMNDAEVLAFTRMTCDLIENMRTLEKPIVAALNGTTCGAGAVMAAAADVRIACDEAKIAFLFTKVGLCGADMGAAWLLPRIVGLGHASELLMLGEFVDAKRAHAIGLYNKVVPLDELLVEAQKWAQKLADGPTMGMAVTKRMLNAEYAMTLPAAMQAEGWIQAECMKHPDYKEGFDAAMAKRPPEFRKRSAR